VSQAQPFHGFVALQSRGLVALPRPLRERYRLDEAGAQLEVTERADGVIELRPMSAIPANEAWFWDSQWQEGEREVDVALATGEVMVTDGAAEFLDALDDQD
jgi:antitoxin MazE